MKKSQSIRALVALVVLIAASTTFVDRAVPDEATIYDSDMMGRIKMTAQQEPEVRRILEQSRRDLENALIKHGIDPNETRPKALALFGAYFDLRAIGRRTRSQLAKILDANQLRQYDLIAEEVAERVRRSARL